jgi:hypothetical protein
VAPDDQRRKALEARQAEEVRRVGREYPDDDPVGQEPAGGEDGRNDIGDIIDAVDDD